MAVWSVVNFRDLEGIFRIDAEYYQPHLLQAKAELDRMGCPVVPLGSLVLSGYRVVYENTEILDEPFDEKQHVKFLPPTNIEVGFSDIDSENLGWISRTEWERYPQGRVKRGEMLIEVKGKAEKVAIVPEDFPQNVMVSGSLYKMTLNSERVEPHYVLAYMLSNYGCGFRDRGKTNTLISYVSKDELYAIPVPLPSIAEQRKIAALCQQAYTKRQQSKSLYAEAECLLLHELHLDTLDLAHQLTYERNFSELHESQRWDSEYWGTEYVNLVEHLQGISHNTLNAVATFSNGATPLGADYLKEGVPFLRIQNINKNRLDLDDVVYISEQNHKMLLKRSQLQPGDVLITITGRIGTAAVIPDDLPTANMNQHSVRLRILDKDTNPYYLAAFLNSRPGLLQTEREAYGTTREALPYYCLKRVLVPQAPRSLQQEVERIIRKGEQARQDARQLLETAKKRVEDMILTQK